MIQAVIIAVLEKLAAEYAVVRQALSIYETVKTMEGVKEVMSLAQEEDQSSDAPHVSDYVFFYILGTGFYERIMASSKFRIVDQNVIFDRISQALIHPVFVNQPDDVLSKIAAFADSFGRLIAIHDPQRIEDINREIASARKGTSLLWYSQAVFENEYVQIELKRYLQSLTVPDDAIKLLFNVYSSGLIRKSMERRFPDFFTSDDAEDEANTFIKIIQSKFFDGSAISGDVMVTNGTGSIIMNTISLPRYEMNYRMLEVKRPMYQTASMTSDYSNMIGSKIMKQLGYVWKDRAWVRDESAKLNPDAKAAMDRLQALADKRIEAESERKPAQAIADVLMKKYKIGKQRVKRKYTKPRKPTTK